MTLPKTTCFPFRKGVGTSVILAESSWWQEDAVYGGDEELAAIRVWARVLERGKQMSYLKILSQGQTRDNPQPCLRVQGYHA